MPFTNMCAEAMENNENPLPDAQGNLANDDLVKDDVCETSEGDILTSDIVVDEQDNIVLATDEVLEDVGVIDSDDEFQLEGQIVMCACFW